MSTSNDPNVRVLCPPCHERDQHKSAVDSKPVDGNSLNEQALDAACIAKIANGSSAEVWRDHWAWIVANAPEDAKDIRDGVRTAVAAYLTALPNDEAAFTAALKERDAALREYWSLKEEYRGEVTARVDEAEQRLVSLYRQKGAKS